ncbi:arpin [Anaeramoeba flamelloides]|uniref:Arpin n=1 Tax=Anaeramoeba flamelloides TaxID=1746091 RepID=A0AAV7ZUU3_9EUKA|nr:arpin [Anaeramoeba flamelloides]KAJ6252214.1 arpin [Anaeramoeba flamelloides]|eukprot:Anaeramoba_flamelloidesa334838_159.p1 GENE.a334838_159~~a334838_159.p1  ORF type:complete len:205 (-),score=50.25 a334838_159:223-837(-)
MTTRGIFPKEKWPPESHTKGKGFVIEGKVVKVNSHVVKKEGVYQGYLKSQLTHDKSRQYTRIALQIVSAWEKNRQSITHKGRKMQVNESLFDRLPIYETPDVQYKEYKVHRGAIHDFWASQTIVSETGIKDYSVVSLETNGDSIFVTDLKVLKEGTDKDLSRPKMNLGQNFQNMLQKTQFELQRDGQLEKEKVEEDSNSDWDSD